MKKGQRSWGQVLAPNLGNKANIEGACHLGKKLGNFGGSKSGISDWSKVVPFGRKPRYVAVPDREPGTGTNYEKRKWNTTFRSEIPTGKTGPPF